MLVETRSKPNNLSSSRTSILKTISTWVERRRQRQALADLDACFLEDIGISNAERVEETNKPFWQR